MDKIKTHHIVKLVFGFVMYFFISYLFLMTKYFSIHIDKPIKNSFVYTIEELNYYLNNFVVANNNFIILFVVLIIVIFIVYIMDITLGVGRSRSEEKEEKKKKEIIDNYMKLEEKLYTIPIFFDEIAIGDHINTIEYGEQIVGVINYNKRYITLNNGVNYYPNKKDMYEYIYGYGKKY